MNVSTKYQFDLLISTQLEINFYFLLTFSISLMYFNIFHTRVLLDIYNVLMGNNGWISINYITDSAYIFVLFKYLFTLCYLLYHNVFKYSEILTLPKQMSLLAHLMQLLPPPTLPFSN